MKLLRSYGRFLEDVRNDPWTAARYYAEADKIEERQDANQQESMLGNLGNGDGDGDDNLLQSVRTLHNTCDAATRSPHVKAMFCIGTFV